MENLKRIFKALSDETRLRIIGLLFEREICICELEQVFNLSLSTISRHMNILKMAGLVKGRRDGQWIHYHLEPKDGYVRAVLRFLKEILKDNEVIKEDKKALSSAKRLSKTPPRKYEEG